MDRDEGKRRLIKPLQILDRYKYVLLVAAVGVALLLWPSGERPVETEEVSQAAPDLRETEAAMEEILSKIGGVGRVDVMLTLHSGSELVLAQDASLRYSGSAQAPDSYERSTDTVTDSGGVVVTQERYPQFRGALVVCEGGGNDAVRLQVVEAVSALTGLGADRIAVVRWQSAAAGGAAEP